MNKSISHITTKAASRSISIGQWLELTKYRLTSIVVLTAVGAFAVASMGTCSFGELLLLAIGGYGVTGASNALNQVLEKDFDSQMSRTKDRPVASGQMTSSTAVLFAGFTCLLGVTALALFNPVASFFGMLAFVLYAFVYTPLKRYSSVAVTIGAIAGAMPMAIGVLAYDPGNIQLALFLFAIQFAWQFPHFWAIAYLGFEEYDKAGFQFIPEDDNHPSKTIGISSIVFSILLIMICAGGYFIGEVSFFMSGALVLISGVFCWYAIRFYKRFTTESARQLMFYSLIYIPAILFILIMDKIWII